MLICGQWDGVISPQQMWSASVPPLPVQRWLAASAKSGVGQSGEGDSLPLSGGFLHQAALLSRLSSAAVKKKESQLVITGAQSDEHDRELSHNGSRDSGCHF